jgi:DinB superfamily
LVSKRWPTVLLPGATPSVRANIDAVDSCDACGFVWAAVASDEIAPRLQSGAAHIAASLRAHRDVAARRPEPERWSMVEYASHVRDVLLHVRDRLVIGLVEDNPEFKPLYRDQRVDHGLYGDDDVDLVTAELLMAAGLFARTFERIDPTTLDRPVQYAFPTPSTRTLLWMGQQVVHEVEHHAADIDHNARID